VCLWTRLISYVTKWSQPFATHFVDNIHPNVNHLGAWLLRPFGLDSATTNQSESFNYVLKRLQDWKEAPIDALVLSLFRLAQFHVAEIRRGRCGQGDFTLPEGVEPAPSDAVPSIAVHRPSDIVARIRDGNQTAAGDDTASSQRMDDADNGLASTSTSTNSNSDDHSMPSTSSTPCDDVEPDDDVDVGNAALPDSNSTLTAAERASVIVKTGLISFDPKLSIFTVNGTNEPRVVRLFPSVSCSCPAKGNCYHVMAAKQAIGMPKDEK